MLIWIDETGSTRRNSIRSYGYSDELDHAHICSVSGKRLSAIPVMTTHGIENVFVCKGSVDGEVFQQFLCHCVLPIILPFDGNNPQSVIMMDNANIHHLERVYDITGAGISPPIQP